MNTIALPALQLDAQRFAPPAPRCPASPRFVAAMEELEEYIRRQPDVTLGELRAAFVGTGFVWDAEGNLALSPSRAALVAEFDELIERHGWNTQGALLFL